jgi:Protein of unknown function (DUF3551)
MLSLIQGNRQARLGDPRGVVMDVHPARLYSAVVGGQVSASPEPATTETTMQLKILAASALAGGAMLLAGSPAKAQGYEYPYCASGAWGGGGGCSYSTLDQCRASISGVGGSCVTNPRYAPNPNAATRTRR